MPTRTRKTASKTSPIPESPPLVIIGGKVGRANVKSATYRPPSSRSSSMQSLEPVPAWPVEVPKSRSKRITSRVRTSATRVARKARSSATRVARKARSSATRVARKARTSVSKAISRSKGYAKVK